MNRELTNFDAFSGSITPDGKKYAFNTLHWTNNAGKPYIWNGYIALVSPAVADCKYEVNWDESSVNFTRLESGYIEMDPNVQQSGKTGVGRISPPKSKVAMIWTVNGRSDLNPTTSIPTFIHVGKNLTKKNATNQFTQALINLQTKYYSKIDKGYSNPHTHVVEGEQTYFMMAFHKWEDSPRDLRKHIVFPAAVSIKYDGTRTQAHRNLNGVIIKSTRRNKLFPPRTHIDEELSTMLSTYPGLYIDAEAFIIGENLNVITGKMTKEEAKDYDVEMDDSPIKLNIFDCFVPDGEITFTYAILNQEVCVTARSNLLDRTKLLTHIFQQNKFEYLCQVKQRVMYNEQDYDTFHDQTMEQKHEGTIIRNLAAPYEFSKTREVRSYHVRKRKPRYNDEFRVVGYTTGRQGKAKGAIILILQTQNKKHTFHADPEDITMDDRRTIYGNMTKEKFDNEWVGKMMTVTYHALSPDGKPLQPKVSFNGINVN